MKLPNELEYSWLPSIPSVLRPLINILELFQLVISEDNTCKVECFVGVRAPKPAKIIEMIWFSDPQVLSTGSNDTRHFPSAKYTKKIGRLVVSITNLKIHIINAWCCMWSPQAEIQFHIMSLWSLQKFTWAERWNNSLKAYFRYKRNCKIKRKRDKKVGDSSPLSWEKSISPKLLKDNIKWREAFARWVEQHKCTTNLTSVVLSSWISLFRYCFP